MVPNRERKRAAKLAIPLKYAPCDTSQFCTQLQSVTPPALAGANVPLALGRYRWPSNYLQFPQDPGEREV
jgi:hypothetical protein